MLTIYFLRHTMRRAMSTRGKGADNNIVEPGPLYYNMTRSWTYTR